MNVFVPPKGINFHLKGDGISAEALSDSLDKTAAFLRARTSEDKLVKYIDWWEHNGLHFIKDEINFGILFSIIAPPRRLLENMPGVDSVFLGIAPADCTWYLRFYLDLDDNGRHLEGRFDITVPESLCGEFEAEVVNTLDFEMEKEASEVYYRRIIG